MWRGALAGAGALALCGCFSLPKPPPFEQSVAAGQLQAVGGALPPMAASAAPGPTPMIATALLVEDAATPPPERTEIRGAGDKSMKLDGADTGEERRKMNGGNRVVVTAKGIPHRAPNFSSEQAASMMCAAQKMGFNGDNARRMHEATLAAERAKIAADNHSGTVKQWEQAELKRQDAVINYMLPVPVLNWMVSPVEKRESMPAPIYQGVVIEEPDLFTFKENGKQVLAIAGVVRNTSAVAVELPPITLRAIDQWGYAIAGQTSLLPFVSLEPGEAKPFETRFLNPPAFTTEVYVHFAPPFAYRSARDCDFFNPSTYDETASIADAKPKTTLRQALFTDPLPSVSTETGPYAASELNELMLFFRREAEAAWRCEHIAKDTCSAAQRLNWRDMFVLSEALDEAWVAERAAGMAGDPAGDVAGKAGVARDRAVARVRALAEKALARAGARSNDIAVAVTTSTYGRDENGLYVEIGGTVRNTSGGERKVDTLMVAFVDRLELPLSSIALDVGLSLAPGETKTFTQRREAGRGGGRRNYAPARIPPREIPWQVRVGAMARE